MYLFRAVEGQTVDFYLSEKSRPRSRRTVLKASFGKPDYRAPGVFARDKLRSHPTAIRELQREKQLPGNCLHRTRRCANNRIESDHRHIKRRLRAMQGPKTTTTASVVIAGIEAVQMIRKGASAGHYQNQPAGTSMGLWRIVRSLLATSTPRSLAKI